MSKLLLDVLVGHEEHFSRAQLELQIKRKRTFFLNKFCEINLLFILSCCYFFLLLFKFESNNYIHVMRLECVTLYCKVFEFLHFP